MFIFSSFLMFGIFCFMYEFNADFLNISHNYNSRYLSIIHSVIVSLMSISWLLDIYRFDDFSLIQSFPIGYCLYDIIYDTYYNRFDVVNSLHHISFIFFAGYLYNTEPFYVVCGYLSEISTPFLYLCYFEIKSKNKNYNRLKLYGILLLITYFIFRILIFGFLFLIAWYYYIIIGNMRLYIVVFINFLFGINILWFYKLIEKFVNS